MNKTIGIVGWSLGDNSFGVSKPYLEYLSSFGDVIILTPTSFVPLDLLVLPGGKDIVHSNERPSFWNSAPEQFLEHFDRYTLPKYIENGTPILGICRGFQTLMRHFGIPLIQNISALHGRSKDEDDSSANKLSFTDKYRHLFDKKHGAFYNSGTVGSWHHQGVSTDDLTEEFELIASCTGLVEYVKHKTLSIVGIQSHPERNQTDFDDYLINSLLKFEDDK